MGAFTVNKKEYCVELIADKLDSVVYNGCDDADIEYAKKVVVPQPVLPMSAPIPLKNEYYKKVPRRGVVCTLDKSLTPGFQETMYSRAGCSPVYLESGHAPFFSKAEELSEILMAEGRPYMNDISPLQGSERPKRT